MLKQFII